MSAWTTTVGRLRRAPPAWRCRRRARAGSPLPVGVALADGDQGVGHPLVERRAIPAAATGPGDERALDDGVLVLGEHAGQAPASIVEAEEAPGVEAGRPLVGLVPSGHARARGPAWPTSASPVRPAVASVSGLATSTRGFTWSKESFPCDSASAILGSDGSLAAAVTHSRAVAAETPQRWTSQATMDVAPSTRQACAPVEFHDGRQQLALVGRDRPVMLGDAGHEALGSPRHRGGSGSVSEEWRVPCRR